MKLLYVDENVWFTLSQAYFLPNHFGRYISHTFCFHTTGQCLATSTWHLLSCLSAQFCLPYIMLYISTTAVPSLALYLSLIFYFLDLCNNCKGRDWNSPYELLVEKNCAMTLFPFLFYLLSYTIRLCGTSVPLNG